MANDLNQCSFIGRLGADPEIRYTTGGDAVASFSIAVGSKWKSKSGEQQESTEWVSITAWGKLGEICAEYLRKGGQVFVGGKMKTEKWEKDGITRYSTKIIADNIQMLGSKPEGGERTDRPAARPAGQPSSAPKNTNYDDFDSDIPF